MPRSPHSQLALFFGTLSLTTLALPAQRPIEVQEERAATRLLYLQGVELPAEICIQYGRPFWREPFAAEVEARRAQRFRLGNGFWANLDTNVDLELGGKRVPASVWYLGLQRTAQASWNLTLFDRSKVQLTRATSGSTRDLRPDIVVPAQLTRIDGAPAAQLTIRLSAAGTPAADGGPAAAGKTAAAGKPAAGASEALDNSLGRAALVIEWGPFRMTVPVQVGVKAGNPEGEPPFAAFDADRVVQTASGLRYEELRPGAGASPGPRSKVEVHYVGWTLDGTRFDSSFARRQSAEFPLGGVIRGWTEGIQLMRPGAVFRFEIPAALAYGQRGAGTVIKPGATLVFWVQLISFTG